MALQREISPVARQLPGTLTAVRAISINWPMPTGQVCLRKS
jgi:hypothetical protein